MVGEDELRQQVHCSPAGGNADDLTFELLNGFYFRAGYEVELRL
jgi:hypothetical protein